jgi:hypothetical protein
MRQSLIIILILFGQVCHAQWKQDTTISKRMLDSLHQELARFKDAAKQTYFNHIIISNTARVDSIYTKDNTTLTITNYSLTKTPLRIQEIHFDKTGCKSLLNDTYFDTSGLKRYEEQWKMGCNWENNITGFLQYRYRYHYDKSHKEIGMTTESFDGGGHRVRYFEYTIDQNGKKNIIKNVKLFEHSFWD